MGADPASIAQLLGGGLKNQPTSGAESGPSTSTGGLIESVINFGDQIVKGEKGGTWNLFLIAAAAALITAALVMPRTKKPTAATK